MLLCGIGSVVYRHEPQILYLLYETARHFSRMEGLGQLYRAPLTMRTQTQAQPDAGQPKFLSGQQASRNNGPHGKVIVPSLPLESRSPRHEAHTQHQARQSGAMNA